MKSAHRITMEEVLLFLQKKPQYAEDIGARLWPDKIGFGSSHGGPAAVAVAASWLLGRMRKRGLVEKLYPRGAASPGVWAITGAGQRRLNELPAVPLPRKNKTST